jgi:hypothetical protein
MGLKLHAGGALGRDLPIMTILHSAVTSHFELLYAPAGQELSGQGRSGGFYPRPRRWRRAGRQRAPCVRQVERASSAHITGQTSRTRPRGAGTEPPTRGGWAEDRWSQGRESESKGHGGGSQGGDRAVEAGTARGQRCTAASRTSARRGSAAAELQPGEASEREGGPSAPAPRGPAAPFDATAPRPDNAITSGHVWIPAASLGAP